MTSKFAVRAFSECLRYEVEDCPDVHVATMLPQAVDTPIFDHAANYARRKVRPTPPLEDADTVADGILRCAQSPKQEVTYSRAGRALEVLYTLTPRIYRRIAPGMFTDGSFSDETSDPHRGNRTESAPGPAIGSRRCCRIAFPAREEPASASGLGGLTASIANGNR